MSGDDLGLWNVCARGGCGAAAALLSEAGQLTYMSASTMGCCEGTTGCFLCTGTDCVSTPACCA